MRPARAHREAPAARDAALQEAFREGAFDAVMGTGGWVRGAGAAWQIQPLRFSAIQAATGGLVRISGGGSHFVLKQVRATPGPTRVDGLHNWRREPLAYQSGLLASLPPGLRAPRCAGVRFLKGSGALILLEDLGAPSSAWTLARYRQVAFDLGRFNGLTATSRGDLPRPRWLSRRLLHQGVSELDPEPPLLDAPQLWRTLARRGPLPRDFEASVRDALRACPRWLAPLDGLPEGLAHQDLYAPNLFRPRRAPVVAIDWALLGPAPVGVELGQLLANTVLWRLWPERGLSSLRTQLMAGYTEGLRSAGIRVRPAALTRAVNASAAIRAALFAPFLIQSAAVPALRSAWTQRLGPVSRSLTGWARGLQWLFSQCP